MLTFTLDTNCIIALDENRLETIWINELITAHNKGRASVGVVAISASEKQKSGHALETFIDFKNRLARLGLEQLDLIKPMAYYNITFWDFALWNHDGMETLEKNIHEILFPNIEFLWANYCANLGLDPAQTPLNHQWKNAKCDVQALWSHAFHKRDVFVTSDKNFHAQSKKQRLLKVTGGLIEFPENALLLLKQSRT